MSRLSNVWAKTTDLVVTTGSGSRLTTIDGEEYLDFTSGVTAASTGHCHPVVTQAITEQAGRLIHGQVNVVTHDLLAPLADQLAEITPENIGKFFFANSGSEITEAAVKLCKQVTGRPNVVSFNGSFHGRTHLGMAMSASKTIYRSGHGPLPSGTFIAPFPDPLASDQSEAIRSALAGFDRLMISQTSPEETAAVIIEPVLGEGGYVPAPREFIESIAQRCRDMGVLFVADEIQSGFGRTGSWFAIDRFEIDPDVLLMGKGMASGFPFSAMGLRSDLDDLWPRGSHGSTFGGNPMGCAAALATIEVMSEPGFFDNVNARGEQLKDGLRRLKELSPSVRQVRGPGLMIGVSFETPQRARAVVDRCFKDGKLLLLTCGTIGSVVRWMPPLTVTADEISEGLDAFEAALRATEE